MFFRIPDPPPHKRPGIMGDCPKCHAPMLAIRYDATADFVHAKCSSCGFERNATPKDAE